MPIRRYKPEQIVTVLRQIGVAVANRKAPAQACRRLGCRLRLRRIIGGGRNREA